MQMWLLFIVIVGSPIGPPAVTTLQFGDDINACTKMERIINNSQGKNPVSRRMYAWCYRGEAP